MNIVSKTCICTDSFIIPVSAFSENTEPIEIGKNEVFHITDINDKAIKMKCEYKQYSIEISLRFFIEHFEMWNKS